MHKAGSSPGLTLYKISADESQAESQLGPLPHTLYWHIPYLYQWQIRNNTYCLSHWFLQNHSQLLEWPTTKVITNALKWPTTKVITNAIKVQKISQLLEWPTTKVITKHKVPPSKKSQLSEWPKTKVITDALKVPHKSQLLEWPTTKVITNAFKGPDIICSTTVLINNNNKNCSILNKLHSSYCLKQCLKWH